MSFRSVLFASATGLTLALAANQASALAITGSSQGSFDDLDDCDNSGSDQNCRITGGSNGNSTLLQWGSTSTRNNFSTPSTLTAVDLNLSLTAEANDVTIARLDWFNSSTRSDETPTNISLDWDLVLSFSVPNTTSLSHSFELSILNTTSSGGDRISGFSLSDLSDLVFDLNGITVSDLKYSVVDGSGSCSGTQTNFASDAWYNCETNNASIYITADIKETVVASSGIPEPATLAIFTAGLLGLGAARRRWLPGTPIARRPQA